MQENIRRSVRAKPRKRNKKRSGAKPAKETGAGRRTAAASRPPRVWRQSMAPFFEFLEEIHEARKQLGLTADEECFFRGQSDVSYALQPTLLRKTASLSSLKRRQIEADLFFEFRARARELHRDNLDDWEILQYMRHHGVATRLLDWTESLGVAIYFALAGAAPGKTPCVWLLNPWKLNEISWEVGDLVSTEYFPWSYSDYMIDFEDLEFDWKYPVATYPIQRSPRLQAQRGYFTIHGTDVRAMNSIPKLGKCLKQVRFPDGATTAGREFLAMVGITEYALFPDLDHLALELHRKNRI